MILRALCPGLFRHVAMLCCIALAACSSGGDTTGERLAPILQSTVLDGLFGDAEEVSKPPVFTRAELNDIPFATVAVRDDDNNRIFVVPLADNGGYIVYQDATRRGFTMLGGLVTATQGVGYSLAGVRNAIEDPIARPTPITDWPESVFRSYEFKRAGGARDFQITTSCRFEVGARERIEIIELFFDTVRVVETCSNTVRTFQNLYWVDPNTGFIWRSEQWTGPKGVDLKLEIIRPYAAG